MIDLLYYYMLESSYLRLFVIALLPVILFPAVVLLFTRYVFVWFNPEAEMTAAKMFLFVCIAVILSLAIMFATLSIFLPPGTDLRGPILFILVVSGLLGAGRLYLVEDKQSQGQ